MGGPPDGDAGPPGIALGPFAPGSARSHAPGDAALAAETIGPSAATLGTRLFP
jgi:hypothetical protein